MKLTESLTINQQQLIVDDILELACKAGIIKSRSSVANMMDVYFVMKNLQEAMAMERPVKHFTDGVIMPQGSAWLTMADEIDERTGKPREVKTSRVISQPGANRIDEFETLNTVYRAVPGVTVEDLRVPQPEDEG